MSTDEMISEFKSSPDYSDFWTETDGSIRNTAVFKIKRGGSFFATKRDMDSAIQAAYKEWKQNEPTN